MKNVRVNVRGVYWKTMVVANHMNYISVYVFEPGVLETTKDTPGNDFSYIDNVSSVSFGIEIEQTNANLGMTTYSINIEDEDIYIYNKDILLSVEIKKVKKPAYTKDIGVGSRFDLLDL